MWIKTAVKIKCLSNLTDVKGIRRIHKHNDIQHKLNKLDYFSFNLEIINLSFLTNSRASSKHRSTSLTAPFFDAKGKNKITLF